MYLLSILLEENAFLYHFSHVLQVDELPSCKRIFLREDLSAMVEGLLYLC